MTNEQVIERLKQGNWYVECKTEQEANLLLRACDDAGITWNVGHKATEFKPYKHYPVDIGFHEEEDGITYGTTYYKESGHENITDWFFNAIKNNDDNGKLTPQNAEQEHWVQIILARLQGVPIEYYSIIYNEWLGANCCSIDINNTTYRIKPTPTPLPISREIWSHLNKIWTCATMDRDGRTFWHQEKPTKNHLGWDSVDSRSTYPLNFNSEGINWETSLTERPEGV